MDFTRLLKQTAVYWDSPSYDGYSKKTFADPVEISIRWEDKQELFMDSQGKEKLSQAVIYINQDVVVGAFIYLGTLSELGSSEEGDPYLVANAKEVKAFGKSPDVGATQYIRKVWI